MLTDRRKKKLNKKGLEWTPYLKIHCVTNDVDNNVHNSKKYVTIFSSHVPFLGIKHIVRDVISETGSNSMIFFAISECIGSKGLVIRDKGMI